MPAVRGYGLAALMLEGALVGLSALEAPFRSPALFLLLATAAFAAFLLAARRAWRDETAPASTIVFIFAAGVIFRATLLPFGPSDDMNRYLWEGRVQLHGFNPFALPPDAPELTPLRDAVYERLNGKPYTAIYPPLAQVLFLAAAAIAPTHIALKTVFLAFDLLTGVFLLLLVRRDRAPPARVLLYLWCPQLLFSIAGRGHVDAVQTCLVVLALVLFKQDRVRWSAFVLGLAIMAKTLALLLVPVFFLHAERRRELWPLLLPLALYLPYAGAGAGLVESLRMFGLHWTTNASLHHVCTAGGTLPFLVYPIAALAYLGALLRARRVEHAAFGAWAVFLLFSPTVHPWYLVGVVPFLALRWRPAWLLLSYTLFFYYSFLATGTWHPLPWVPLLEYLPFYTLLIWEYGAWLRRPT